MKVVQSCALVILVLLVTVSANNGKEEIDFTEFEKGLSDDSRAVFNSLNTKAKTKYYDVKKTLQSANDELSKVKGQNNILQQQKDSLEQQKGELEKQKGKLEQRNGELEQQKGKLEQQKGELEKKIIDNEDKEGYNLFTCAVDNIKSSTELIYPQYKGKNQDNRYQNYLSFKGESDCILPELIAETVVAFTSVEKKLTIASHHNAFSKIPRFFCDMQAFLTRFDHEVFGLLLLAESHGHAETITRKITESKLNGCQKEQAIIDFACRYARIRHGVNVYFHHFLSVINDKTKEIFEQKRATILAQTNTDPEESQISVTLPEVLDYIGFLTAWNFTTDDLTFMNTVSEIARPSNEKIYVPYHYDVKDGNGKTLKGVLPYTDQKYCPLTPRASTTTDPNKRNR